MLWMHGYAALFLITFLVASTLSVGLQSGTRELRSMFEEPDLLVRAIAANFVVVPLVGIVLSRLLPLTPAVSASLLLLACTPGGLSSMQFTSKIRGEATSAAATLVVLCVLAVLISPWMLYAALPSDVEFTISYGPILRFIGVAVLAPLAIGVIAHDRLPDLAARFTRLFALVGTAAFIGFMLVTRNFRGEALGELGLAEIGSMLVLLAASMAIGWWLGGPATSTRRMLATTTGMRNAALCLVIAQHSPSGGAVLTPLIAFSLLMVPPNMLFTVWGSIRARRSEVSPAHP